MKIAAARAVAGTINERNVPADYIVPSVFNERVVDRVAEAVETVARDQGVARSSPRHTL